MMHFLDIVFSLPTALFSWPLLLVIAYWISALAGFNAEGLGAEGALEVGVDGALEAGVDGAAESFAGGSEGIGLEHHDGSLISTVDGSPGFFDDLSFGDVPRSITWSLAVLIGWSLSLLGVYFVPGFETFAARGAWAGLGLAGLSLALAMPLTLVAIQPLRKALEAGRGPERSDLLGQMCTVTTQRVDDRFGQAELEDGSSLIQVRDRLGRDLARGQRAVIFDYDPKAEVFFIAPVDLEAKDRTSAEA
ncbi:MAG: hypothetical protein AAF725_03880 [Acidobacteriota bacterium]